MSFLNSAPTGVRFKIRRGYSYVPRTFNYGHENEEGVFVVDENDGWEVHLEVFCTKDGAPVFEADSTDSGGPLTIDSSEIIVEFGLTPEESGGLDFSCCDYEMFLYKGSLLLPDDKKPFLFGEFKVT